MLGRLVVDCGLVFIVAEIFEKLVNMLLGLLINFFLIIPESLLNYLTILT